MATIVIEEMRFAFSLHGGGTCLHGPEAATQTFLKGALLVFSAGYIQECGADPAAILGVAAEDGHNDTTAGTSQIKYYPLTGNVFEANLAQAAANTTSATTDLGTKYGVIKRSTGTAHWVVDSAETSSTRCVILNWARSTVATDVNARVQIHFFQANDELTA